MWPAPLENNRVQAPLSPWGQGLLERRGIVGPEALQRYLEPSLASLDDPLTMAGMAEALEVLQKALAAGAPIVVFGDYDVDGVCSTAVLVDFLKAVGANVTYYIPDRRAEGYGLNEAAVRQLAGPGRVLITTDCGITAHGEIALAKELGAEVVVVDHHKVPEVLPPASACLVPHRPDCAFPCKDLCAAGVAFMLVVALRRSLRQSGYFATQSEPDVRNLLDLVAVATVADMVPMRGLNRVLVSAGIRRMGQDQRLGLSCLLQVARVDPRRIRCTDLGFRIGPRINARGRLSHAGEAVELLLTTDAQRGHQLALALDGANEERRALEKATVAAAIERVQREALDEHAALVVYDELWHPGVLGLVATRLVGLYHRPAVVIGEGGKGSGRSVEGLDLHAAISVAGEHLLRFGGHAAAAGITLAPSRIPAFRVALAEAVRAQIGEPPFLPVLRPDLEIAPEALSMSLLAEVERLSPFGQGNPEPLWVLRHVPVHQKRLVGGEHLKLVLGEGYDAIAFGLGRLREAVPEVVDVAFRLERNNFRGRESLQLRVEDLRASR